MFTFSAHKWNRMAARERAPCHVYCSSSSWILPCEKQAMDCIRGFQIVFCSSWGGSAEVHLCQRRLRVVGLHSSRAGLQPWSSREVLFLVLAELFWTLLICLLSVRALNNIYFELKGAGSYWKKSVLKPLTPKLPYNSKLVGVYDLKFKRDVHGEYPHLHPDVPIVQLSDSLLVCIFWKTDLKKGWSSNVMFFM